MAFVPRLNDDGIVNNFHWYSDNIFWQSGYGMPNCTCYAWGRFWEIGDPLSNKSNKPVNLPTGSGGQWWEMAIEKGYYKTGQSPQLGAVACFLDNSGGDGHVAIVEEIKENGDIVTSNSAWQSTFFWLMDLQKSNNYNFSGYTFQGFIYNPFSDSPTPPQPTPVEKKKKFNWVLYLRNIRKRNIK